MKQKKTNSISKTNKVLKNKVVLITGGAGSVGSALAKKILKYSVKTIRVFDNSEYSLFNLKRSINDPRIKFLLGSIQDKDRVEMAGYGADIVIHTAAVKNIEISEFNALDTIDTNVMGTVNLIKMAIKNRPEKFLNISTDKVVQTTTLYGATKLLSERVTTWAGVHIRPTKFASIRFGNIIETKGNVFEVWKNEAKNNLPLSLTHPEMRRYFIHMNEATELIIRCIIEMKQGEIFIPKMKNYKIKNLAMKISRNHKRIKMRPGEKLEEVLITDDEKKIAKELRDMWIIKPQF